jgi:orotidine-5'-phosphate decarboxylase
VGRPIRDAKDPAAAAKTVAQAIAAGLARRAEAGATSAARR